MRAVTVRDGVTTFDLFEHRLVRSVQKTCRHERKDCISTSQSGSDSAFVQYVCLDCRHCWTEELLPAEYERLIEDEYSEPLP